MALSASRRSHRGNRGQRPLVITILCVFIFIMLPLSLIVMANGLQDADALYGKWFTPFFLISKLLTLTSFLGLWFMYRWGVYLYAALFIVGQTSGYFLGMPISIPGLVGPIVIIGVLAFYFRRMR